MLVCVVTNFFLRRSILELELAPFADQGPTPEPSSRAVRLYYYLTNDGLVWSFIASVALLFIPTVLTEMPARTFVVLAYVAQLTVSSLLFARLGLAYRRALGKRDLQWLAIFYGSLQLAYPFFVLPSTSKIFELVLTINKLALGALVIHSGRTVSRRPDASDVRRQADPLDSLGTRMLRQASLQRMLQASIAFITVAAVVVAIKEGFTLLIARTSKLPAWSTLLLCAACLPGLWLLLQLAAYLVLIKSGYRVRWRAHANGALASVAQLDDPGRSFHKGWTKITLSARVVAPETKYQIILLHGLFSHGERCWGLLPAILLDSGKVVRTHLLSYQHSLWTSAARLKELGEETVENLLRLVRSSTEPTILFGHSLGGLMLMRFLVTLLRQEPSGTIERIEHVVFVAPPITGTLYAYICWPWSWCRTLSPRSELLTDLIRDFTQTLPPPMTVVGEERPYCTVSFLYGIRDHIVGRLARLISFPGHRVTVPEWHTLPSVFSRTGPQAENFLAELSTPSRSLNLMHLLAANLIGKRTPRLGVLFAFAGPKKLAAAWVIDEVRLEWGSQLLNSTAPNTYGRHVLLAEVLRPAYEVAVANADHNARSWESFWDDLIACFERGFEHRETIRLPWPTGETFFLFCNRSAGFAVVVAEESDSLSYQESMRRTAGHRSMLAGMAKHLAASSLPIDLDALEPLTSPTCSHPISILDSLHEDHVVSYSGVVDGSGNYFGIYERSGVVARNKSSQGILVHAAAYGPMLRFPELKATAIDLIENIELDVEPIHHTPRCQLWRMNFTTSKQAGEPYAVRWFFRWPHCMSLDRDIDVMNLSILPNRSRLAVMSLQMPSQPLVYHAGLVADHELRFMPPSDRDFRPEVCCYRLGITVTETTELEAIFLYYKLPSVAGAALAELVEVGPASASDLAEITALRHALTNSHQKPVPAKDDDFLVAKVGERVVGFLQHGKPSEGNAQVMSIFFTAVVSAFRGFGIGRKMINYAIDNVRGGIPEVQLTAPVEYIAFYESLGFSPIASPTGSSTNGSVLRRRLIR